MSIRSNALTLNPQALERREMPSVTTALVGGALVLTGDDSSDGAAVIEQGNQLVVYLSAGGAVQGVPGAQPGQGAITIPKALVGAIYFIGEGGDDLFVNATTHGAYVDGGSGNDTLGSISGGRDILIGGDGDDLLVGSGTAMMVGGSGRDTFGHLRGRDRVLDDSPNEDNNLGDDRGGGQGFEPGDDRGGGQGFEPGDDRGGR